MRTVVNGIAGKEDQTQRECFSSLYFMYIESVQYTVVLYPLVHLWNA